MNSKWGLVVISLFAVCVQSGCTTQIVVKPVSQNPGGTAEGIIYSLPMLALRVQSSHTLKSCTGGDDEKQAIVEVGVNVEPFYVPDPVHTYSISYHELERLTKATDLKITLHPNGMLKSVNAELTDNTGPIIAKTVGQVLKLAIAATGGIAPAMNGTKSPPPKPVSCHNQVRSQVKKAEKLDEKIIKNADLVDEIDNKLSDLPANHVDVPNLKAKRRTLQESIKQDTKSLQKLRKPLAVVQSVTVFPGFTSSSSVTSSVFTQRVELPVAARMLWFANEAVPDESVLVLDVRGVDGRAPPLRTSTASLDKGYLVYRQSAPVRVTVCAKRSCWDGNILIVPDTEQLLAATYSMPQAGSLARLEIKNGPFAKNTVAAEFSEDGNLGSLTFITSTESIEKAQKELDQTIKTYGEYRATKQDSATNRLNRLTKQNKAQKELVDSEKELIESQSDLDKARTQSAGSP